MARSVRSKILRSRATTEEARNVCRRGVYRVSVPVKCNRVPACLCRCRCLLQFAAVAYCARGLRSSVECERRRRQPLVSRNPIAEDIQQVCYIVGRYILNARRAVARASLEVSLECRGAAGCQTVEVEWNGHSRLSADCKSGRESDQA